MAVDMNLRRQNLQHALHTLLDCADMLANGALEVNEPTVLREAAVTIEVLEARISGILTKHQGALRAKAFGR